MASSKSSSIFTSKQEAAYRAKEAEQKRKDELARERARLDKEAAALFGDDSFVTPGPAVHVPNPSHSTKTDSSSNSTSNIQPTSSITASNPAPKIPLKITTAAPVVTKKSASLGPLGTINKSVSPPGAIASIKKTSVTQPAPKKISVAPPVLKKTPAIVAPPLPEIKYTPTSASSVLPSLAEWRAAVKTGKPLSTKLSPSEKSRDRASESRRRDDTKRGIGRRREEEDDDDDEGSDLEDFLADSEEDLDETERRHLTKKRKASKEMDDMWEQLRAITGYNPNNAKFLVRDRMSLREATADEAEREERKSRIIGRKEDADQEAVERMRAEEKARRLKEWRRKQGLPSDEEDQSD